MAVTLEELTEYDWEDFLTEELYEEALENCNFVFGLALFFHFFSDSSVFHVRNLICHLFDVTLQSFLIEFFCEKIFPVVFCQFFHGDCHNLFQCGQKQ